MAGRTLVVLFTRDLRVHDHPALHEAALRADQVAPLFVLDDGILGSDFARPNRLAFLRDALVDLDGALRARGARLLVRRGDVVAETVRVARQAGAEAVHVTADVSAYARSRERRLARALEGERIGLVTFPGATVLEPGAVTPGAGDHFAVFTPYLRRWSAHPRRALHGAPGRLGLPAGLSPGRLPARRRLVGGPTSPDLPPGGETAGRERMHRWLRSGLPGYGDGHDDLAGDRTSRLSPYLHFGCISPLEAATLAGERDGGEPFVRQLAWRDFHHQVLAARPDLPREDYRPRGDRWRSDDGQLAAWREGRTGYPLVDAGMRQLAREGWMHNRARLVTGSFLTKTLYLDWRLGAAHFWDLLVDGDLANNAGNWQWIAGTGNDTRPNRVLNPLRQAERHDPDGDYVRRHVPELALVPGPAVHEPWRLDPAARRRLDYPEPIVAVERGAPASARRRARSGALVTESGLRLFASGRRRA
jgi:deoxyribodipyrimidine photo-lyase